MKALAELGRIVLLLIAIAANTVNVIAFLFARQIINLVCMPAAYVASGIAKALEERT